MAFPRIDGVGAVGAGQVGTSGSLANGQAGGATSPGSFSRLLSEQLFRIDGHQHAADSAVRELASGKTDNVQDVVMAMAQADLTFRFALEIRNRLLESYQEIMRMQM